MGSRIYRPHILGRPRLYLHQFRLNRIQIRRTTDTPASAKKKDHKTGGRLSALIKAGVLILVLPTLWHIVVFHPLQQAGYVDILLDSTLFQVFRPLPRIKQSQKQEGGLKYQPLADSGEIRLLVLEPGQGDEEIQCYLVHAPLAWRTHYEALSYTWGDQNIRDPIICAGERISVTSNLRSALKSIRCNDRPRVLWVDALCINQNDMVERGKQVKQMGKIYTQARQVLICLVGQLVEDKAAIPALKRLHAMANKLHYHMFSTVSILLEPFNFTLSPFSALPDSFDWTPITRLLEAPWFERTWIIQEAILARRAVIVYGGDSMPFHHFRWVCTNIQKYGMFRADFIGGSKPMNALSAMTMFKSIRSNREGGVWLLGRTQDWHCYMTDLLSQTRGFACTDERDKIYGMLGVATDVDPNAVELDPNYDLPVEEVFRRFIVWDIKSSGRLKALSLTSNKSKSIFTLPSWVPDLTQITRSAPLSQFERRTFRAWFWAPWNSQKPRISEDGKVLTLDGHYVDTIQIVGSINGPGSLKILPGSQKKHPNGIPDPASLRRQQGWMRECWQIARTGHIGTADANDGNYKYWAEKNMGMTPTRYKEFWTTLICGYGITPFRPGSSYGDWFRSYAGLVNKSGSMTRQVLLIERLLGTFSRRRRFCATKNGALGMVPSEAKPGDVICTLYGGAFPFVLRPKGDKYELIGEAYVHGVKANKVFMGRSNQTEFALV